MPRKSSNKAKADAEALIERARGEIGAERDRAIQDLRAEVATMVVEATQIVLGAAIDAKAHERLIDEALQKVGTNPSRGCKGRQELTWNARASSPAATPRRTSRSPRRRVTSPAGVTSSRPSSRRSAIQRSAKRW